MADKKASVDWSKYGWCPTCERTAGAPCKDMRYASRHGEFSRDKPHKDRERVDHPK